MDAAHLHLILNHLSVLGTLFGLLLLGAALLAKKPDLRAAALVTLVIAGASAWPTVVTGGGAEEIVEGQPNVSQAAIEEHEEAAEYANIGAIVMAILALATLLIAPKKPAATTSLTAASLFAAILVMGMMARTAYLGGLVAHPELRGAVTTVSAAGETAEREDESHED